MAERTGEGTHDAAGHDRAPGGVLDDAGARHTNVSTTYNDSGTGHAASTTYNDSRAGHAAGTTDNHSGAGHAASTASDYSGAEQSASTTGNDSGTGHAASTADNESGAGRAGVPGWRERPGPVAVLTGAGISTSSGIPDFRGPHGVWTKNPIAELSANYVDYLRDPELRTRSWIARRDNPAWRAEPNAGHLALAELERHRSVRILTQNIDRLHHKAGSTPRKVLELHGNMFEAVCTRPTSRCGWTGTMREVLDRVEAGDPDPACEHCGGILKAATVMFGQHLDEEVLVIAGAIARSSAIFLAVGSSLRVQPAAGLCELAVLGGADLVIVNNEPTPYDELATELVREPISEALPQIVAELNHVDPK